MDTLNDNLKKISATLFLYNEPISASKLKTIARLEEISKGDLENIFNEINQKLDGLGLVLIRDSNKNFDKCEVAIMVRKEMSEIAKNIKVNELEGDLTPASLQVMTICAYLNGATKHEINLVRGVQSSQSIRSLSSRGMIKSESGKYFPTLECLAEIGISKIEDLPEYEKVQNDFKEKLREFISEEK